MPLTCSRKRLSAFLDELRTLEELDFGYPNSEEALQHIRTTFERHRNSLEKLTPKHDPDTVLSACSSALTGLFNYLPLVGFIVRSTESRNAFEVYAPLLRLAQRLLGSDTKLVLSSEWDYSPYTYFGVPSLPRFVFIGLPAPESSNPLLVPLAGHELGHSIWQDKGLAATYSSKLDDEVVKCIKNRWDEYAKFFPKVAKGDVSKDSRTTRWTWDQAATWAAQQSEETFCDFVGVRLFGKAYLHAFAYLLGPSLEGARFPGYPSMSARVESLIKAAESYQFDAPIGYRDTFHDLDLGREERETFLLSVADTALTSLVDDLITEANQAVGDNRLESSDHDIDRIEQMIKKWRVPANKPKSLATIINAAWNLFEDDELWKDNDVDDRDRALQELVLKNIEVLEIEERLG